MNLSSITHRSEKSSRAFPSKRFESFNLIGLTSAFLFFRRLSASPHRGGTGGPPGSAGGFTSGAPDGPPGLFGSGILGFCDPPSDPIPPQRDQ
jgi:hypothetical protein